MSEVRRYICFDDDPVDIGNYTSYVREHPKHPLFVLATDYDAKAAECERLLEALAPFSNMLHSHHEHLPDDRPIFAINGSQMTAGDLRRARAALKGKP